MDSSIEPKNKLWLLTDSTSQVSKKSSLPQRHASPNVSMSWPRCILSLLQQQCLIFWAQSLLPGIEVILEATHGHLASSRSGSVHDETTLARQTAQHPGAQRQQHHGKEVHGTGHSWCARKKSRRFNVQSCTSDAMNLNQCPTNLTVGMEQDGAGQKTPISACEKHEAAWYQKYLMTLVPAVKQKTWYSSTMSTPWHCGLKKKWSTCRQFTPCQFVTFNCQSWKLEGISLGRTVWVKGRVFCFVVSTHLKKYESKWEHSPNMDEHKKSLKRPT